MSKEPSQAEGYMKIILGQSGTTREPPCWKCNGRKGYYSGEVRELRPHDKGTWHVCTACNGTGKEKVEAERDELQKAGRMFTERVERLNRPTGHFGIKGRIYQKMKEVLHHE